MLGLFGSLVDLLRLVFSYLNRRLSHERSEIHAKTSRRAEGYETLAKALRVRRAARDAIRSGGLSDDKFERKQQ